MCLQTDAIILEQVANSNQMPSLMQPRLIWRAMGTHYSTWSA